MDVGIIDADLIGSKNHRFPNLASMKISGYMKDNGHNVCLLTNYDCINNYDTVYVSKVFTNTKIPTEVLSMKNVKYGGTGFFFDKAPALPYEIEHHMPDYHLYDDWIRLKVDEGISPGKFKEYTDYSIGFTTRGCFRKCQFCVNRAYNKVVKHSDLQEFIDVSRKKICLLDDNILGYVGWREVFDALIDTGKKFRFRQGLDERLLTDDVCKVLFNCKYDGHFYFAFDSIKDYNLISRKLDLIRKYNDKINMSFYVLVGFESVDFNDVENMWRRINLLMRYQCLPYIMRYIGGGGDIPYKLSEFCDMYTAVARWCNQPSIFKKKSFREYCELTQNDIKTEGRLSKPMQILRRFENEYPEFAARYFDIKFSDFAL